MTVRDRSLLILSEAEVRRALPMREAIEVMKGAFQELFEGKAIVPPRSHITVPEAKGDVLLMPAYSIPGNRFGLKVITLFENNRDAGLPFIQALVVLFDSKTGSPIAVMDGASLTAIRSGAVSGAATDLLASKGATKVAIFGAGTQARTQLEAICAIRGILEARVFDKDKASADAFARETSAQLHIRVTTAKSSAQALDGAEIVCTATTSATPVFADSEIAAGTHINAMGVYKPHMREIPPETVVRSYVVVDQIDAAWKEAGDLIIPFNDKLIRKSHIRAELGELVSRKKKPPTARGTVTFFKSVGLAIQDLAAASMVLVNADRLGLGTKVRM